MFSQWLMYELTAKVIRVLYQSCWYVYRSSVVTVERFSSTYRNTDIRTRKKYVNLVESVKKFGGTVHIFSSMHVSGDREYPAIIVSCIHFFFVMVISHFNQRKYLERNEMLLCWKCGKENYYLRSLK
jgi:hypothetical protein